MVMEAIWLSIQHMEGDSSTIAAFNVPVYCMLAQSGGLPTRDERLGENYSAENWTEISLDSGRSVPRDEGEWAMDQESEVAEVGTTYASSDATVETVTPLLLNKGVGDHFQPAAMSCPILPESFEEQMMLAMAVSLAEARARPSPQGLAWL
ncbi:E3 ubiquitin-protein ligase GW2-like isoform X1 [Tasmannia lanceolata]|uniref:E3 ubiquitin-protein ligase GW2-like isoform X1 n=1 Tax=Tasmannia lanceolata TaxID=3420 RepID=UPI00406312E9